MKVTCYHHHWIYPICEVFLFYLAQCLANEKLISLICFCFYFIRAYPNIWNVTDYIFVLHLHKVITLRKNQLNNFHGSSETMSFCSIFEIVYTSSVQHFSETKQLIFWNKKIEKQNFINSPVLYFCLHLSSNPTCSMFHR